MISYYISNDIGTIYLYIDIYIYIIICFHVYVCLTLNSIEFLYSY